MTEPVENETWTEHHAGDFTFFTGDGVTLLGWQGQTLETARERWRKLREKEPETPRWRWERWANHEHPSSSRPDRERVFYEWVYARELAAALREAFPHRSFIVSYITLYAVSFHGWEEGADGPGVTVMREPEETVFCEGCQSRNVYTRTANADVDIPDLRWVRCANCDTDCLLGEYEVRTLIGPGER